MQKNPRIGVIFTSKRDALSTMSLEWKEKAKRRRFRDVDWNQQEAVQITTLDELIENYGMPKFVKIDVEGYESDVLQGLHNSVKALSCEFTKEMIEKTLENIDYLESLGNYQYNVILGEETSYAKEWVNAERIKKSLLALSDDLVSGDIYAKAT